MIGSGLMAMPIARGSISPIAAPMCSPVAYAVRVEGLPGDRGTSEEERRRRGRRAEEPPVAPDAIDAQIPVSAGILPCLIAFTTVS